ncbi:unnamed protein product [Brassica rapa]|uniref:Uncharacterized protein n=1 Tax=Brassica campestris TaxID=3711 RepID=A0A8D9HDJ4_BRACM|nr:unnamed protein product [Brassica rapa]
MLCTSQILRRGWKVWLEDVDVIYSVIEDKLSCHYIGVEIQLMDNTITLFHCGLPKANIKRALNQIQELAVLISAIKMELLGEEMLECRSLGLKSMANINDETAMDLRSKLCCEIFDQFMDKDFQEGCIDELSNAYGTFRMGFQKKSEKAKCTKA